MRSDVRANQIMAWIAWLVSADRSERAVRLEWGQRTTADPERN